MAIDHIDLLLIHRPDPLMDHHETGAALDEVVASGKVGAVGVSNFRPWDWSLLQSAMKTPIWSPIRSRSLWAKSAPSPTVIWPFISSMVNRSWRGRHWAEVF